MTAMKPSAATPKYTVTNESITVVWDDRTHTVQKGTANFLSLRRCLLEGDWSTLPSHLTVARSVTEWAKGRFAVDEAAQSLSFDGQPLPREINARVFATAAAGKDPSALLRFYERLQKNPSWRSVQQLYKFLEHRGIPIAEDGCFLAYKGVREDFKDCHSNTFDNSPGQKHEMPRNQISDDPDVECAVGFHVGSEAYARGFGARVVICKIDPADVVAVPKNCEAQKVRTCRYEVVGHLGESMSSTTTGRGGSGDDGASDDEGDDEDFDEDFDSEDEDELEHYEAADPVCAPTPANITVPVAPVKLARSTQKVSRRFRRYLKLTTTQLLDLPLAELRQFASHGLKIVGATKIPGGKTALVNRIVEVMS